MGPRSLFRPPVEEYPARRAGLLADVSAQYPPETHIASLRSYPLGDGSLHRDFQTCRKCLGYNDLTAVLPDRSADAGEGCAARFLTAG